MYLVNARQMREMDRFAIEEIGIPSIVLLEAAGQAVAEEVEKRYPRARVTVIAGPGNNGGDAFVAARHLSNRGFATQTWFIGSEEKLTEDAKIAYRSLVRSRYPVQKATPEHWESFCEDLRRADVIIDGMIGVGMKGAPRPEAARAIQAINGLKGDAKVVAVDIPSGVNADNGETRGEAVMADVTITFECPRWGHFLFPGAAFRGELVTRDIGIPKWVGEEMRITSRLLNEEFVSTLIPTRSRHSHKGSYGHVLIISGSRSYAGAPVLAALGAIRSGSGMTTLAIPESIQPLISGKALEAVYWLWADDEGHFSPRSWETLIESRAPRYDFVVVGPGIGQAPGKAWLKEVINHTEKPLLLDADALNLLAQDLSIIKDRDSVILTPHPGEMARLIHSTVQEVENNRRQVAVEFAREHQVYLLLKGTYPIIATPEGKCYVSPRGSSALAKGGSGDVLSGMIGSFVNQTGDVLLGMLCAVYAHGMAGELMDEYSGGASDLGKWIGQALQSLSHLAVK